MPIEGKIDRHQLHEFLWKKVNSRGIVRVHHQTLAEDLGVNHFTISRIFREFIKDGRAKKLDASVDGVAYLLRDPVGFEPKT